MTHPSSALPRETADITARRRDWLAVLARASRCDLEAVLADLPTVPGYTLLRPPESGAIMVSARAGGSGRQFNLGEASVTRCTVRLDEGTAGVAYALGRDRRHAELAAVLDALLQAASGGADLYEHHIRPLARQQQAARDLRSRQAAATKVDFFTLVRGDG